MKTLRWILFFLSGIVISLHGCNSDPFPIGELFNEGFEVPLVTTRTFNFKTGSGDISGLQGNLKISSGADVNNLVSAIPGVSEQSNERGVISGVIINNQGQPIPGVSIGVTDINGSIIRDSEGGITAGITHASGNISAPLFYNSINGVPEFINNGGTGDSGSFTALNVTPGEHFIKAVQGGRGNGRVSVFAGGLSIIDIEVFPVALPASSIIGSVSERDTSTPVAQAEITLPGLGGVLTTNASGNYSGSGFGSDSRFLARVRAAAHQDSYQELSSNLALLQAGVVTPEIIQNLTSVSTQDLQSMAQATGSALIPGRGMIIGAVSELNAVAVASDSAGNSIGEIFYFPPESTLPTCNISGGAGCLTMTSTEGKFLVMNLPPGDVFLKVHAEVVESGGTGNKIKSSGQTVLSVFSDGITLTEIDLTAIQRTDTSSTVALSGVIREEDGVTAVGSVAISILGVSDTLPDSNPVDGSYAIPRGPGLNDVTPLLANGTPLLRLQKAGTHVTTYQPVSIGREDLVADLTLVSSSLIGTTAGTGAILGRVINRRSGGRVNNVEIFTTQMIDPGNQVVTNAQSVGNINYFNGPAIDATLTATSTNGLFLIRSLPPGLVMIKANSSDDSGNQIVRVFADGVTKASIFVNHVPINVPVQGSLTDLHNNPVTGATLSLAGEQQPFSSDTFISTSGIPVPSNSTFITQVQKAAFINTLNHQLKTGLIAASGLPLFISSQAELAAFASQGGISLDLGKGIIAGEVREQQLTEASPPISPISSGLSPKAIAAGDFNEDTILDLAVAQSPDQIQIFLGQETGIFLPQTPFTVGTDPRSIAVGDFNTDGRPDLAVANRGSDSVSIHFGTGNGAFVVGPVITSGIGTAPVFVLRYNLEEGGRLALAVANEGSSTISVLLGDGAGNFSSLNSPCPTPCTVEPSPQSIAAGDFDGDGNFDLAIASAASNQISILLSTGNLPGTALLAGSQPASIASGDLNGDTFSDLVVANAGSDSISAFLGNGNGGFSKVDCLPTDDTKEDCPLNPGNMPSHILLHDFDGDGRLDLALANKGTGTVAILTGLGDGRFETSTLSFTVGSGPKHLASADFNQDGRNDLVVVNNGSNNFSLLLSAEKSALGVRIEARDPEGNAVGTVLYMNTSFDVDPTLTASSDNGRFIVFDLPVALVALRGTRQASPPLSSLIGNALVNITQEGSLYYTHLNVDSGTPASIILQGITCRPVGIICARVGNVDVSFLGTTKAEICLSDPNCISNRLDGKYTAALDPHSTYVVKLIGPDATLPGDTDGDGVPDQGDNCPNVANQDQLDSNGNRIGDACEFELADDDGDGIPNGIDNCPLTRNPGQQDDDQDGIGNVCDPDFILPPQ